MPPKRGPVARPADNAASARYTLTFTRADVALLRVTAYKGGCDGVTFADGGTCQMTAAFRDLLR